SLHARQGRGLRPRVVRPASPAANQPPIVANAPVKPGRVVAGGGGGARGGGGPPPLGPPPRGGSGRGGAAAGAPPPPPPPSPPAAGPRAASRSVCSRTLRTSPDCA